jgi:hypothetical protein
MGKVHSKGLVHSNSKGSVTNLSQIFLESVPDIRANSASAGEETAGHVDGVTARSCVRANRAFKEALKASTSGSLIVRITFPSPRMLKSAHAIRCFRTRLRGRRSRRLSSRWVSVTVSRCPCEAVAAFMIAEGGSPGRARFHRAIVNFARRGSVN